MTYFIDQIENFANFAKWARNQDQEVKILRESMVQTSPTAEMASFVFQMHVSALQEIEDWWTAEHLPSLDFEAAINRARTINLRGLQTTEEAKTLASRYLKEYRPDGVKPKDPLHPFPEEVIKMVRDATKGNPRKFLETLGQILDHAVNDGVTDVDLTFVEPLLGDDYQDVVGEVEDDDFENVEALTVDDPNPRPPRPIRSPACRPATCSWFSSSSSVAPRRRSKRSGCGSAWTGRSSGAGRSCGRPPGTPRASSSSSASSRGRAARNTRQYETMKSNKLSLTDDGRELLTQLKEDRAATYDNLFRRLIAQHPYVRDFIRADQPEGHPSPGD